jgi:hypothetical protein
MESSTRLYCERAEQRVTLGYSARLQPCNLETQNDDNLL